MNATRWLIGTSVVAIGAAALSGCAGWQSSSLPFSEMSPPQAAAARPDASGVPPSQRDPEAVIRGQAPGVEPVGAPSFDGYWRQPMPVSGSVPSAAPGVRPASTAAPLPGSTPAPSASGVAPLGVAPPGVAPAPGIAPAPGAAPPPWPSTNGAPGIPPAPGVPSAGAPGGYVFPEFQPPLPPPPSLPGEPLVPPGRYVDIDAMVEEARTGRFMFGVGMNSEAGLTGQIMLDERNFDLLRFPTSFQDIVNGTAWRGAGQGFRLEAVPGSELQRYLMSFTEPYLLDTPISLNLSAFYFDRRYFDWDEKRLGGRLALGYRLTPDLSLSVAGRAEKVNVHDPRVVGIESLDAVLGDSELFSGRATLTHDTRDVPFSPTEGHLLELSYEQVFGSFDYPRGDLDYRQYFLVRERPDGSGRHTLSYSFRFGVTGSQTPVFENYFAGGFSTLRGFEFRGASPVESGVSVGGEFLFLGSVEYLFPLTADDMLKGVVFCDYGTVEPTVQITADDYRVAPGFGLRIAIPALGPAPLALDFAFPIAHADTDDIRNFSFFFGFGRG